MPIEYPGGRRLLPEKGINKRSRFKGAFAPFPSGQVEPISIDKFGCDIEQPDSNFKRLKNYSLAATVAASAFVAVIASDNIIPVPPSTHPDPVFIQTFQYETDAEPVRVDPPAVPAVYVAAQNTDPIFIKSFQYDSDVKPLTTPAAAPTDAFVSSSNPDPIRLISFQYDSEVKPLNIAVTPEGPITLDKWKSAWSDPYFRPKRLIQYGVNCAMADQADDGLPPVYWIPPTNQPAFARWKRPQNTFPDFKGESLFTIPSPPQVSAVFVSSSNADPIRIISFQYESEVRPFITTAGGEVVTVDKWFEQRPERIAAKTRTLNEQSVFVNTTTLETITLDKWFVSRLERQARVAFPQSAIVSPLVFTTAEIVTTDKWFRQAADMFRVQRAQFEAAIDLFDLTQPERASIDKWGQPQSQPRQDFKRQQSTFQFYTADGQLYLIPPIEIIRLDKWVRQEPDLVFRAKRLSDYSWSTIDPTLTTERVSIDKFGQPISQPFFRSRVTLDTSVNVSIVRTPFEWNVTPAERPRAVRSTRVDQPFVATATPPVFGQSVEPIRVIRVPRSSVAEILTALRFTQWVELVQPFMPRDVEHREHLYPLFTAGADITLTLGGGIVINLSAESRVIEIKAEDRVIIIPVEDRTIDL